MFKNYIDYVMTHDISYFDLFSYLLARQGLGGTIPTSFAQLPKLIGLYLGEYD